MNKLKRISCVLFSFCLIISFVSCRKDNADEDVSDDSSKVQTADNITNNEIRLLSVNKKFVSHYEWCEDFSELLVKSEYSDVTLDKSVEEKYPTLAKKLSETSAMRKRLMEDEKDNFIAFANEEIKRDSEAFSTYVSTLDVQVRRADSVVVSILEDCYSDGRRAFNGINYDTESGKELVLSDVFTDTSNIASAVEKELMSRIGEAEPFGNTAVIEYFINTPDDSFIWTLDYNGVTFFFNPGDIAPTNFGIQIVSLSFAKYPDLFVGKYTVAPDSYIMGMPLDSPFFIDANDDGKCEEYKVSGSYDYDDSYFYTLDISSESSSCSLDWYAHSLSSFYVKTADNRNYIYIFSTNNKDANSRMSLAVFEIKNGNVSLIRETDFGMQCLEDGILSLPINPAELCLFDYESATSGTYFVGENGLPQLA